MDLECDTRSFRMEAFSIQRTGNANGTEKAIQNRGLNGERRQYVANDSGLEDQGSERRLPRQLYRREKREGEREREREK